MQMVTRGLYLRNKHLLRKDSLLCTVFQHVNADTTVSSSEWLGVIKIIAKQVVVR